MRLYIANPTRQEQVICYRLDFNNDGSQKEADRTRFQPAKQQAVPPGRQIQLGGDFHHQNQITDIVDQLKPYGLIGAVDVARLSSKDPVVPYVFNIDQPVSSEAMRKVQDHNAGILIEQGRNRRSDAAIATSEIVQNTVANQFMENGIDQKPADQVEVAYEQLEQSEQGEKTIAEGYRVAPEGKGTGRPAKPNKRAARARR